MAHVAIIGCGHMGAGLAERLSPFHSLFLYDLDWNRTQELAQKVKGKACKNLNEVKTQAEIILLAIKPQNLQEFAHQMEHQFKTDHILISLLSGTPLSILKHYFPHATLIRIMPNLAVCYGMGVIGIVEPTHFALDLKEKLQDFFSPLGMIYWLKENQIDALTSLTSSGPAFIFTLIEAMMEAGVAMGFQAHEAQKLILQMLKGCIALLEETQQHPAELKRRITSPNGTTIAGLRVFEQQNIRSGIMETFIATYQRAQELAKS